MAPLLADNGSPFDEWPSDANISVVYAEKLIWFAIILSLLYVLVVVFNSAIIFTEFVKSVDKVYR